MNASYITPQPTVYVKRLNAGAVFDDLKLRSKGLWKDQQEVAEILVNSIYNAGVKVAFGVASAKIDAMFDKLRDHSEIKLIP
ncbi:hypothetical protein LTR97_009749 [Elasticomyces elasticus]|uniref:Uncharacterized protein n=1 Tax=Elasticomyces elasticus TaxID=574655 RepID=A0AAN7W2E9_9PEZI|nr:hypothetical protein LTR97_009749 [Elasticomyces elasticus]